MDRRLKEIMDNFESLKIGVDETFKFHCTMCSSCCFQREDILLSPKDLYSMAKELKISTSNFVQQYCEVYVGGDSRVPLVRLLPRGSAKRCPLLKNRKCSVHKAKPAVCALYPIGRCLIVDKKHEDSKEFKVDDIVFIHNGSKCGDNKETHTVREWLETFGIPVKDEFFIKWQNLVMELGETFRKMEKIIGPDTMQMAWTAAYVGLYLHYDTEKEFLPQFEENAAKYLEIMHTVFPKSS